METIPNQILGGTRLDGQGERVPKEVLQDFATANAGRRMPLNQRHDMKLGSTGFVENIRLVPDEGSPGDWSLVGDVSYDPQTTEFPVGGFSISFATVVRPSNTGESFVVYLPFPHHNDPTLVEQVFEEGYVSVGRLAAKEFAPATVALIVATVSFVARPVWDNFYKTTIAPKVSSLFRGRFKLLRERGIAADFMQTFEYEGNVIKVRFLPLRGKEEHCFSIEKTSSAMFMVHEYTVALDRNHIPVEMVFLTFDEMADKFVFSRVQFSDGTLARNV